VNENQPLEQGTGRKWSVKRKWQNPTNQFCIATGGLVVLLLIAAVTALTQGHRLLWLILIASAMWLLLYATIAMKLVKVAQLAICPCVPRRYRNSAYRWRAAAVALWLIGCLTQWGSGHGVAFSVALLSVYLFAWAAAPWRLSRLLTSLTLAHYIVGLLRMVPHALPLDAVYLGDPVSWRQFRNVAYRLHVLNIIEMYRSADDKVYVRILPKGLERVWR
jgi:hypothetical protein